MTSKKVCSLCELVMQEGNDPATHGYCPPCLELTTQMMRENHSFSVLSEGTEPTLMTPEALDLALKQMKDALGPPEARVTKLRRWSNGLTLMEVQVAAPTPPDLWANLVESGFVVIHAHFPMKILSLGQRWEESPTSFIFRKAAVVSEELFADLQELVGAGLAPTLQV